MLKISAFYLIWNQEFCQDAPNQVQGDLKSDNLQYNTMERWIDGTIVPPSDGPRFILIDWE